MIRLISLALLLTSVACVQAQTFKIATVVPDGTIWMKEMRQASDEITRRTAGRVKFRFYPGGVMGNDTSVLRKIRIGQLHGGALTGGGLTEIYLDSQIYSLPFAFKSYEEVDFVRRRMDSLILTGLKKNGFISFGLGEGGFAYLMSNQALRSIDDLKKKKVWTPQGDRISRSAFEAIGVSPIPLPLTDVLTGLQTGLIDTVGTSPIGAIALQWHTRIKYLTDIPLLYLYGTLVIKRSAFEKLSLQDQNIMQDAMARVFRTLSEQNRRDNREAREALQRQGISFVLPQEDKLAQWNQQMTKAMDRLAQQGVFTAAMLKTLKGHLHDFRQGTRDPR